MYILLALLSGVSIVISRMLNAKLSAEQTLYQGTLWNYITGLLGSVILLLIVREPFQFSMDFPGIRPYIMFFGGALGVMTVTINSYITPRLSAFYLTIIIFISQLFSGLLLDYFLYQEFSFGKLAGGIFVMIGLIIYSMEPSGKEAENAPKKIV